MIIVGPNLNAYNVSSEYRDRESQKVKEAGDFILALLKRARTPKSIDEITDAYEIKCERAGMSRKERRDAVSTFDHYRRIAVLRLSDMGKVKINNERKLIIK